VAILAVALRPKGIYPRNVNATHRLSQQCVLCSSSASPICCNYCRICARISLRTSMVSPRLSLVISLSGASRPSRFRFSHPAPDTDRHTCPEIIPSIVLAQVIHRASSRGKTALIFSAVRKANALQHLYFTYRVLSSQLHGPPAWTGLTGMYNYVPPTFCKKTMKR
jgi:hypothetical protein